MTNFIKLIAYLEARLSEPSSLASLSAVTAMLGINADSAIIHDWLNVGTIVFGALGVVIAEKNK
jgi:hypothetical protein